MSNTTIISIEADIHAPRAIVWERYTNPTYITQWNHASDDWHCPRAENDLRTGGTFSARMEAKDGSFGFDFGGTYTDVREQEFIAYAMEDGRTVDITLTEHEGMTHMQINFEAETENSPELQRTGWQAILNNFKACAEAA